MKPLLLSKHQFIMTCFLCSSSGEVNNDIVVEMKTDKANEEANLLNKRTPAGQVRLSHSPKLFEAIWTFFFNFTQKNPIYPTSPLLYSPILKKKNH